MAATIKNAYYRIYNGTDWDYYFFKTSAGQVITDNTQTFISSGVTINSQQFSITNDGANASLTLTGANITNGVSSSGHYITAGANLNATLSALDTAAYNAAQSASGYLPLTGNTSSNPMTGDITFSAGKGLKFAHDGAIFEQATSSASSYDIVLSPQSEVVSISGSSGSANIDVSNMGVDATFNFPNDINGGTLATQSWVTTQINALPTPMQFKGTVGDDANTATYTWSQLSSIVSNDGWTLKCVTNSGIASPVTCKRGDTLISDGTNWVVIPSGDEPSGTVVSVGAGTGLVTNLSNNDPITWMGSISIDTTWLGNQISAAVGNYLPLAGNTAATPMTGDIYMGGNKVQLGNSTEIHSTSNGDIVLNAETIAITGSNGSATLDTTLLGVDATLYLPNEASGVIATQEWTQTTFARVTVSSSSTAPSYTGLKSGDIWIN